MRRQKIMWTPRLYRWRTPSCTDLYVVFIGFFFFFFLNTTESSSQVSVFCSLMMDCCECVLLMRVEVSVDSTHKNTMCAPSGRTFLPAPRFPQVIHAVLIPTVMALSWGLDAPSGPPHFCPWPPWRPCLSAARQPHTSWGTTTDSGLVSLLPKYDLCFCSIYVWSLPLM